MQNDIADTKPKIQIVNVHPLPIHIEIIADLICALPDENKRQLVELLRKDLSGIFQDIGRPTPWYQRAADSYV